MTTRLARRAILQGTAASAAALAIPGCRASLPMDDRGWTNALYTDYVLPRWLWAPESARDLVQIVQRAEREGHRVRMTGSGHSFSDVAINDDWLLAPHKLATLLPLDPRSLHDGVPADMLVRLASGMRIHELNKALEAKGLALENMGGADLQTFVGAASTGTHGSGLAFGPLASQIVAIEVVGPGGELLHVEPANGMTCEARFSGHLVEDPSQKVLLRQDDDLFNALAVGLGCLGVIYAVVLRAVPKYWLVERRTTTTWEEVSGPRGALARLIAGVSSPGDPDHVEIYYTPYASSDGTHFALLTERWRTTTKPIGAGLQRGSFIFTIGSDLTVAADEAGLLEPAFKKPTLAGMRSFHEFSMRNLAEEYYANISYDVFSIGILNSVRAYGIEAAFAIEQAKAAVERSFSIAEDLAHYGMYMTSPPSLRFVAPSTAPAAMQYGRRTATLELGTLVGLHGADELLHTYEDAFVRELNARPHWGLDRNVLRSEQQVARLYPAWPKWKKVYDDMNRGGTFDGRFTDRLGISIRPAS